MNRFVTLLFGVGLIGFALYLTSDYLRLQRHGVRVEGTIVDASNRHDVYVDRNHGWNSSTSHKALIEFTPENAAKPVQFSADFWSRQTIGSKVKVLYNPIDAGDAKVDDWTDWLLPLILGVFGVLCLAQAFGFVSDDTVRNSDRGWTLFRWFD